MLYIISVFLCFRQISFNLDRAFAVHRKESFVPALLKVYIDNLFDNLESGKKIIALEKKSGKSLEFWIQKSIRTLNSIQQNKHTD